jgi:hypothetical protein
MWSAFFVGFTFRDALLVESYVDVTFVFRKTFSCLL